MGNANELLRLSVCLISCLSAGYTAVNGFSIFSTHRQTFGSGKHHATPPTTLHDVRTPITTTLRTSVYSGIFTY